MILGTLEQMPGANAAKPTGGDSRPNRLTAERQALQASTADLRRRNSRNETSRC
jgi:hypothetical protein